MVLILVGIISGIVTGLGLGGSALILILVTIMNINQHIAQGANLASFILAAIASNIVHIKNKNIDRASVKKMWLPIVVGSSIGAYLTKFVDAVELRKYFGYFLLAIGVYEIITTIKEYVKRRKI